MKTLNTPLYLVLGNHDANYFRNNPGAMNSTEQGEFYLKKDKHYYYEDFANYNLRLIVLYSFDHTQKTQETRYGFPAEEVEWVKQLLNSTPTDYKVLICSHVPLLAKMHYWSKEIRNSDAMIAAFNSFIKDPFMAYCVAYIIMILVIYILERNNIDKSKENNKQ